MSETEIPLTGGRTNTGIVRIGDTVRRPMAHDHVHDLLLHLEKRGFEGTPRFLGIDQQNRTILSFLPGEVPRDLAHFNETQLAAAIALLRRFHDATMDFSLVKKQNAEVICHNDWGPTNTVFRDGLPYGIIDFDTVAPEAERVETLLGHSPVALTHDHVKSFAFTARRKLKDEDGRFRRHHVRALAQHVEVFSKTEAKIIGYKSALLQTLAAENVGKSTDSAVRSFVPKWRPREDSNLRPSD